MVDVAYAALFGKTKELGHGIGIYVYCRRPQLFCLEAVHDSFYQGLVLLGQPVVIAMEVEFPSRRQDVEEVIYKYLDDIGMDMTLRIFG